MMVEIIGVTKQLNTVEKKGTLDALLLAVVDETLKQVFRESGTRVIYNYMETKWHLKQEKIAERPEMFSAGLESLLRSAGPVIEKMILRNLFSKLELKFEEEKGYQFSDYIKELEEKCGC